jgi:demethylmenaquinone methyltransferase/2-methoxy-6-polyprenyl-1,4-benzoquinol methylase
MEKHEFFDDLGRRWDETAKHDMEKVEMIIRLLAIKPGNRVLDVGTGTGVLIPLFLRHTEPRNIQAIDFAPSMIEKAREKFGNSGVELILGDVMEHPFGEESFDHIVCYSVFPHFDNHPAALERLASFLKPGGLLSILHSQSRDRINGVHVHTSSMDIHHDYLPEAETVARLMGSLDLRLEILVDSSELYMVCGRKPWQRGKGRR